MKLDDSFELELTGMAHGGSAVGRHEGRAVFAPYAIPGERVRARIVQDKKRFALAEVVEVFDAAPTRIEPRCPHFGPGKCGGCQWQHMDYLAQLEFKRQVVADQMRRIGGFENATIHPTLASPSPWAYRTHVTFHAKPGGRLGFVATDGRSVLPVDECHIIRPELLAMFYHLKGFSPQDAARVRLQVGTDGREGFIAVNTGEADEGYQVISGAAPVHYLIKGRDFQVSAGSFFQVNLAQAEMLVNLALERLTLTGTERVLDLYSGVGLFTAFLAERARAVTAVESFPLAVEDARANLASFENVKRIEGAVEEELADLPGPFDAVVLDPPRAGLDAAALDALIRHAPHQIVYVSCDPATLARDAKRLAENDYILRDVQPVDMFPQTFHIESVATFVRR